MKAPNEEDWPYSVGKKPKPMEPRGQKKPTTTKERGQTKENIHQYPLQDKIRRMTLIPIPTIKASFIQAKY